MRIAFLGTRGVPASYSGFETFVEQLGTRLARRGHEVTVYCRRHHYQDRPAAYQGMHLKYVAGIRTKHLDTISHTLVSSLDAARERYDVALMCISGNSPAAILPRCVGTRVVLNVDGSDWRRRKWGRLARAYIQGSERLATALPDAVVTDSPVMFRYYLERFGKRTECIGYGADVPEPENTAILEQLGLASRGYLLLVGRLVPENCADHLVNAYQHLKPDLKCVVVGDAPYARAYQQQLRQLGHDVLFPGYVFGEGYRALMHHAYAVVLCSEVGGTHPVLVEAMAAGNCVVVNNTPANLEVIQGAGLSYPGESGWQGLAPVLDRVCRNPELVAELRDAARERARTAYSWDAVTDQYEALCRRLVGGEMDTVVGAGSIAR